MESERKGHDAAQHFPDFSGLDVNQFLVRQAAEEWASIVGPLRAERFEDTMSPQFEESCLRSPGTACVAG